MQDITTAVVPSWVEERSHANVPTWLEWNERYPPTDDEKRKNDLVYDVQGTYNQFVVDSSELNRVFDVK